MKDDRYWMAMAIEEAELARAEGEVPVGAVVVHRGTPVGKGHNRSEQSGFPFEHAEMMAMWEAVDKHDRFVLSDCTLYVTVEPCAMCTGAALLARVPRIVFGAHEQKTGACESVMSIPAEPGLEHKMTVIGGVEAERCAEMLQSFFRERRTRG